MALIRRETESARRILFSALLLTVLCFCARPAVARSGVDVQQEAGQHEISGDLPGARTLLEKEASEPGNSSAAASLAEFLDRHGDATARDAYVKWASEEQDPAKRQLALRQIVLMDFMAGRNTDLTTDLSQYHAAGGTGLSQASVASGEVYSKVSIPGPLSSFARMAALAPDLEADELMPALARNVVTNGYEAAGNEALQQTEYLRLLTRYVGQARELQAMAGSAQKIVVPTCDSEQTGNLLKILGYRMRGSCGSDIVLETVNPTRAFLTVDSAFPLTQLEQELRANHRFELSYAPTAVPILYNAAYWLSALGRPQSDFLDAFLADPSLCRLYLGLSHVDRATAEALRKDAPAAKLKLYSHVLDFYGSMFQIRNGAAVVPGSPKVWAALVGVSPENPGAFFDRLISTDDGWIASYFDALSRVDGPTAAYLTEPNRMRRFYDALRGKITTPGPARPVFRASTELMLLTTSLRIDANGQPHVPGDLEVWRTLFIKHPHGKYDGKLTRSAATWHSNDDLIEALFGLSRKSVENEPLKMFLALNDIDRGRSKPMSADLATRLIASYRSLGAQFVLFAGNPTLSEASITRYLEICTSSLAIRDTLLRADTVGTLQALVELWQILCRDRQMPPQAQDAVFVRLTQPFDRVKDEVELFEAGRASLNALLASTGLPAGNSPQQALVALLVGPLHSAEGAAPHAPTETFLRIYDEQRLVPLDTLFLAADHLGKGPLDAKTEKLLRTQLTRSEESDSIRNSLSSEEKSSFATGYWSDRHIEQERKFNMDAAEKSGEKKEVRAWLAPFLRDSLVGFVYCYYAPAGAQLLITNPVFVRSHDFIGPEGSIASWKATEVSGSGWPASAGGRLQGSLITLPYAIAEAEQNFLSPKREQALIWADLVPQMIVNVTINKWRNIAPEQLRWVSIHMERGKTLLAAAALDPSIQTQVLDSFRRFSTPSYVEWLRDRVTAGDFSHTVGQIQPSILYAVSCDPKLKDISPDVASLQIAHMAASAKPSLSPEAISHAFGTPKPTLTHSYEPGLLYLRTFPTLMGYSSRILAESWESNSLYYAALADETGTPADRLDAFVPEWNRSAIENIFATHLEDWPALLRSLNAVGESVRQQNSQRSLIANSQN